MVDEIADAAALRDYAPLPAARGDFLFRAGRLAERVQNSRLRPRVLATRGNGHSSSHGRTQAVYSPNEITDWTHDDQTALCAKCGIDSVIGTRSGFPITPEFLAEMRRYWF